MEIRLESIGRKFNYEWIFRNIDFTFTSGTATAVLGSNGSGKSTLLQIISGHLHPSAGRIIYSQNGTTVSAEDIFRLVTYSGPYLELIEEFTLAEMVAFHGKFRKFTGNLSAEQVIEATTLWKNRNKPIRYYSSGMKQRVKLSLAILGDNPIVLLDEPVSNLDRSGMEWYRNLIAGHMHNRLVVICSNSIPQEHDFCTSSIIIDDYKK